MIRSLATSTTHDGASVGYSPTLSMYIELYFMSITAPWLLIVAHLWLQNPPTRHYHVVKVSCPFRQNDTRCIMLKLNYLQL
jgi:hypothetical protein